VINQYDISIKPRTAKPPVPTDFSGPEAWHAIARWVIATHAEVLKALANR
jgi:hypothetical protein